MRRLFLLTASLLAAAIVLCGPPVQADLWSGFYKRSASQRAKTETINEETGCLTGIIEAQARYEIPDNLLLSIGIQEAGRTLEGKITVWPWSVNANGKGIFFKTREQAIGWVKSQQEQGVRSIDVGCMQVNLFWHEGAFTSLEDAFDPVSNTRYAARFLTELKQSEGSWWRAAGSYHSRTDPHRQRYLASLARNHDVANAEYDRIKAIAQMEQRYVANLPSTELTVPRILWGDETKAPNGFSIYSRKPLAAILPNYVENDS